MTIDYSYSCHTLLYKCQIMSLTYTYNLTFKIQYVLKTISILFHRHIQSFLFRIVTNGNTKKHIFVGLTSNQDRLTSENTFAKSMTFKALVMMRCYLIPVQKQSYIRWMTVVLGLPGNIYIFFTTR